MKVLIIGYVWPEPTSSAAGLRDDSLIQIFRDAGWAVTFMSPAKENDFSERLRQMGVSTASFEANDSRFDAWIRELGPDLVVFDRFVIEEQFGWRVQEALPDCMRVLDTQDLHFLRRARMQAVKEGKSMREVAECGFDLVTEDALREMASVYRNDLTLMISDFERDLLVERFRVPAELVELFQFCYPPMPDGLPEFEGRRDFVMIGNFRHPPNHDGVMWFKREIWSLIRRELPDVEVHLYGAYPPKEIMALDDARSGFRVLGWAEDQYEVLRRYRVNLAPLRFGAGIKGKIADGWWCGTPVVTTPIGAEGMTGGKVFGGSVGFQPAELARAAVELYRSETLWREARDRGLGLMRELFDHERNAAALVRTLGELKGCLRERRARNVVGAMLWHHQFKSTKYFSKWIEEKNKPRA